MMHITIFLLWLFMLCWAPFFSASEKTSKGRQYRKTVLHEETHSPRQICDPPSSSNTAGETQKCTSGFYRETDGSHRECITSGDSSWGDHCHGCDGCTVTLLLDLENMDDVLTQLKQLEKVSNSPGSLSKLKHLQANISNTGALVQMFSLVVRNLEPKVKQLETDVDGEDLKQLMKETLKGSSDVRKLMQNVNGTKQKAEDQLSEALLIQDLINQQMTEVKHGVLDALSDEDKAGMMMEAQLMELEMKARTCKAQREKAEREQEDTHTLLDVIRSNMTLFMTVSNQTADWFLTDIKELLSDAKGRVYRMKSLIRKSDAVLRDLEPLRSHLQREQGLLHPVTGMTKDLLMNISHLFSTLEEIKKEFEAHAAQIDGAKLVLFQKLNNLSGKVDLVMKAEQHAEQLSGEAAEIQQSLLDASINSNLLSVVRTGAFNSIIYALKEAEIAAHQSKVSADEASKDVSKPDAAVALKVNSTHLWRDAQKTQRDLNILSNKTHQGKLNQTEEKGDSLRTGILTTREDLRNITRDDTEALIESAEASASSSNSSVSDVRESLRRVRQEVDRLALSNVSVNVDNMLTDAEQSLMKLNTILPALKDKITQVQSLGRTAPPDGNMTENIQKIKEMIEETRNFVIRLPIATTFNGKSHVELHPPKELEDIKVFTAVDLLLRLHPNIPSKNKTRRKRRQDKHRDQSAFVYYLGNKDGSGGYTGMAVRNKVLVCVYKLGGAVHEVETSKITSTTIEKSEFDRVVFHRVYQDAEVNITRNATSWKPISLAPKRHRPSTMTGVMEIDPHRAVFYVGGYPEDFTPPAELHYPKFKGAIKLSNINGRAVSLFNFKRAANLEAKQPVVTLPHAEDSDCYEGTGYRLAFIKEPEKTTRLLFKFHTKSRETNALMFYIGNEENFFCVYVERGFLVLQGQQAGRKIQVQSKEKVSLFDRYFAIDINEDKIVLQYGRKKISADHMQTKYTSYYIGGLSAQLRQQHNITAPPLRGCVDQVTADTPFIEYNRTIGVGQGCPVSLMGVRAATIYSALSADSLLVWDKQPLSVSVGFRTTDSHGTLLKGSSQGNDGDLSVCGSLRLELSIDNMRVTQKQSSRNREEDLTLKPGNFKGCISNLYTRRPEQSFLPADLSSLSPSGDVILGLCDLHPPPPPRLQLLPEHVMTPQTHKPIQAPAGKRCRHLSVRWTEYQLLQDHSWLSYTLPQQDLNHRPHFSLNIKTKSTKGLILHVAGRGVVPLVALFIANGKIKMSLGYDRIIHHKQKSNDGDWHRVEFSVERSSFHLLVDGVRVTDGHLPNDEGSALDLMNPVYLGGDVTGRTTKGHSIPMNSVVGCVRDFKMNEEVVGEPEGRHKTLPCSDRLTEAGVYFGGGHIVKDNFFTPSSLFKLSFELRPEHLTGLLLHALDHKSSFSVFLKENKVGVRVQYGGHDISLLLNPPESLCDGKFHLVTVSGQEKVVNLQVDSSSEQTDLPFTLNSRPEMLYIGGSPQKLRLPVSSPFIGCFRNMKLNGLRVSFESRSTVIQPVSINGCPAG
ncbi:laminin subunit alpha-3 isoform X2 [Halichoeres trimaculatus]|uniref:laminin subunit alpha-3 isoform X2 n=1 Tax=Halichoeres trimaculatus TaxID=147232 RepID=UPI003D9DC736